MAISFSKIADIIRPNHYKIGDFIMEPIEVIHGLLINLNGLVKRLYLNKSANKSTTLDWTNGIRNYQGYRVIIFNGKRVLIHRLMAKAFINGFTDKSIVDHIDGNRENNNINNLRLVTARENGQNQKCHRNGKLVGTSFDKALGRWRSHIKINGKKKHLGCFDTELEAHQCYKNYINLNKTDKMSVGG